MWAIIGSSGFESFDEFEIIETLARETPFGLCSNGLYRIKVGGQEALFLCRTGQNENLLPGKINYQANIYALKKYGATAILALSSVRSLREELKPGDMVVPYQYIDRTRGNRVSTFCDDGILTYVSLTHPISEEAAESLKAQKAQFAFDMHFGQAYVCIEGPQFPTMLDARCYQSMGGGIIGMTAFPEFALAREAGIHYLPCHFIVDYVPWGNDIENIDCILEIRHGNYDKARSMAQWVVNKLIDYANDDCNQQGVAASMAMMSNRLTPRQASWFDVLAKSNSRIIEPVAKARYELTLYHDLKPIPKKLQDLLNFINKYRKDMVETLASARKSASSLSLYGGEKIAIASVRDFSVKLKEHEVDVRLYHPDPARHLPIVVYAHGGGFISGSIDSFDDPCRALAYATDRIVVSVEYRLAPEHPYPQGLDDVYEVALWIYKHAADIKGSTDDFSLIGDSAGANLVALAAEKSRESNAFKIDNLVLIYPTTDLTHETRSMQEFAQGYSLDAEKVRWYNAQYLPADIDKKDPAISPFYIRDVSLFPRTFVITAGYDPLRDEGLLFAQKLESAGVEMHHYHFDNMIHGFINFAKLVPEECQVLYQRIDRFLKDKLK
ncbi:MAG: alpha/beta hydrolase fold domain-containing protein [Francisellaceae bacterium]